MEATDIKKDSIALVFSQDEIAFLCNAINETLEAVEEREFQTRTGETRGRAMQILSEFETILHDARAA